MGARDSRSASDGLQEEHVTVLHGVKLSPDVLQRMRESGSPKAESAKPAGPSKPSAADLQEDFHRRFEWEQALIPHRESEDMNPAGLPDKCRSPREELEKPQDLTRQLKWKEEEVKHLAEFYKEQLQLMEKKNTEFFQQTAHMYSQEAVKAETTVRAGNFSPICPELQQQLLNCYRQNKHQTLQCSPLAREYINCVNSSKKSLLVNQG